MSLHAGATERTPSIHSRQSRQRHGLRSGSLQHGCACAGGGARGHHIVDQKNSLASNGGRRTNRKRARHVAPASRTRQRGLNRRGTLPAEGVDQRHATPPGNMPRQQFRLIKSALPLFAPVERYRNHGVELLVERNSSFEEPAQLPRQRLHAGVLEQVNQVAQRAFVESEAGRAVEAAQALSASGTDALFVQRVAVRKRGMTGRAEVGGFKRLGRVQTLGADRYSGPFGKRALADAAFVRKQQRKNAVGDRSEGGSGRSRQATTREGAPPVIAALSRARAARRRRSANSWSVTQSVAHGTASSRDTGISCPHCRQTP